MSEELKSCTEKPDVSTMFDSVADKPEHYQRIQWVYKGNIYQETVNTCLPLPTQMMESKDEEPSRGELVEVYDGLNPKMGNFTPDLIRSIIDEKITEFNCKEPKHIDPKEHPLTPDMVGRVVLVDECNVMALMYIYFDGKQGRRFNYSYASDGVNLGGTLDKSNIKYYYFIWKS